MQISCGECGASLEVGSAERTAQCPYCASPNVIAGPERSAAPRPELVVPFVLPREHALDTARRWVKGAWLAPSTFRRARVEEVRGVYLPTYLFSAVASTTYAANIGENYSETEEYTDSQGKRQTRTVTKTEWRPLNGAHAAYVSDVVVTASKSIPNHELAAIEPFDLNAVRRFGAKLVSGWIVEDPTLTRDEAVANARSEAMTETQRRLAKFMPGDTHSGLKIASQLSYETLDAILVPTYVLPVRYAEGKPPVRLLVNGQTGRIFGSAPVSGLKVTLLVLAILGVVAALFFAVWAAR